MARRLSDLMQVGKEVTFGDDQGDDVVKVFLRKLTPIDLQAAIKHANAARSRAKTRYLDHDSDDYQAAISAAQGMGREAALAFLVSLRGGELVEKHESKIAAEDEWSEDSYLEGLRDSWEKLEDVFFKSDSVEDENSEDSEDAEERQGNEEHDDDREEAERVFAELKRFSDQVEESLQAEIDDIRDVFEERSDDWIFDEAASKSIEGECEQHWLAAFREAEIYYGVRDFKNHHERYFESYEEVRNLAAPMYTRILEEYHALNVDMTEGKSLQEPPSS